MEFSITLLTKWGKEDKMRQTKKLNQIKLMADGENEMKCKWPSGVHFYRLQETGPS